jgi:hypothetical protein
MDKAFFDSAKKVGDRLGIQVARDDETISFNEWVTMTSIQMEVEKRTLLGTTKSVVPGWQIEVATVERNYPHEPDGVDVAPVCEIQSFPQALKKCLCILRENDVDLILEGEL